MGKSTASAWYNAMLGNSALKAVSLRSLLVEIALRLGKAVGVCLWDYEAFFDSVGLRVLAPKALDLIYTLAVSTLGAQMYAAPRCRWEKGGPAFHR